MGWVYLDDRFPEHPKVIAAGDAAAWMFVCALGYASRHHNTGAIPKEMVTRLTGARNAPALARKLVEVALWHDLGDHYEIHDYQFWNASQIGRTEKAKKAAEARWRPPPPDPPKDPSSDAQASGKHHARATAGHELETTVSTCSDDDGAKPPARERVARTPFALRPSGLGCTDSSSSTRVREDDDEGDEIRQALLELAQRDLERRRTERGPVGHPQAWLEAATARRARQHADELDRLDLAFFAGRPHDLANALEPPHRRPDERHAGSVSTIVANDLTRRRTAECPHCDDAGVIWQPDGTVVRCSHPPIAASPAS